MQVDAWVLRSWKALFLSCLHLVGVCFQLSSLLPQICRSGECFWCCCNVLDYMIRTVECHRQRIGANMSGWIGSVKEVVCTAKTELGQPSTLEAPHNQAWTVWSYCRLWKETETCLTRMTWTSWGPDQKHQNVVQDGITVCSGQWYQKQPTNQGESGQKLGWHQKLWQCHWQYEGELFLSCYQHCRQIEICVWDGWGWDDLWAATGQLFLVSLIEMEDSRLGDSFFIWLGLRLAF